MVFALQSLKGIAGSELSLRLSHSFSLQLFIFVRFKNESHYDLEHFVYYAVYLSKGGREMRPCGGRTDVSLPASITYPFCHACFLIGNHNLP